MLVSKVSISSGSPQSRNNKACSYPMSFGRKPQGVNSALNELVNTPFIKPFARSLAEILSPQQFRAFIQKVKDLTPKILRIRGFDGDHQMFSMSPIIKSESDDIKPYTVYTAAVKARNTVKGYTSCGCEFDLNNGFFPSRLSSGKNIARKLYQACQSTAM